MTPKQKYGFVSNAMTAFGMGWGLLVAVAAFVMPPFIPHPWTLGVLLATGVGAIGYGVLQIYRKRREFEG